jgi:hypothetical protein
VQISYMASGSGSAPAGDGIHLSPLLSLSVHASHAHTYTHSERFYPSRSAPSRF